MRSETLEWTVPLPPPHGNFAVAPVIYRGPYEYSVFGRNRDSARQNETMIESDHNPAKLAQRR